MSKIAEEKITMRKIVVSHYMPHEQQNEIKEICAGYSVNSSVGGKLVIFNSEHEISLECIETRNTQCSTSIPRNEAKSYLIEVLYPECQIANQLVSKILEVMCCYTKEEITAVVSDMPLLFEYSCQAHNRLNNVALIFRDHFLEENLGLMLAFIRLGVHPRNIWVLDKGDETLHRSEIANTFRKLEMNVGLLDNMHLEDLQYISNWEKDIESFVTAHTAKKVIVIDDGAIVTRMLKPTLQKKIAAVIELTEMGLRRIQGNNYLCPILNVAKSEAKRKLVYPEIASSVFIRIINLMRSEKIAGRPVIICGYGDMGKLLAKRFRDFGAKVVVYDNDVLALISAAECGYITYTQLVEAVKCEKPILVIGASGACSITRSAIELMQDGTYVTSGATADLSVFRDGLTSDDKSFEIDGYGTQYTIGGKRITVLGNGRSVNLYRSEAIPTKACDLFRTIIALTIVNAVQNTEQLVPGVNTSLVNQWIASSEVLKQYYRMYYEKKSIN